MQLIESGAFDGFARLHVAGHPEGNRDIDPAGGEAEVMAALKLKQDFANRCDAEMAIATQFAFDPAPIRDWAARLSANGITMPVHLGVAGPAKLQTLVKFAIACGVGPSLKVLQKRARDVTKLLLPFEPTELLADLAANRPANIQSVHFFPLGGITASANWIAQQRDPE
jgi:methylenetetrahydrofolate reductase (NADPH)